MILWGNGFAVVVANMSAPNNIGYQWLSAVFHEASIFI